MANCGQCSNINCTCFLIDGSNTDAVGNGSQFSPFAVTPDGFVPIPRPVAHISRTTNRTFVATNILEVIPMNTNNLVVPFGNADAGMVNLTTQPTRITTINAGKYLVGATVVYKVGAFAGVAREAAITRNGSAAGVDLFGRETRHIRTGNVNVTFISLMGLAELAVNDYIELWASSSGASDELIASFPGVPTQPCRPTLWAQWMGL